MAGPLPPAGREPAGVVRQSSIFGQACRDATGSEMKSPACRGSVRGKFR